jgi:diguanylate cyclase (GGDEF) domain
MTDWKKFIGYEASYINTAIQDTIPQRMSVALLICSAVGIILMAVLKLYFLMAIHIAIFIVSTICGLLVWKNKISVETACLITILILFFVYTPASWFILNGLMGCTPYLSILFMTVANLTYYRKLQKPLLISYSVFLAGLTGYWLLNYSHSYSVKEIINSLLAYVIAYALIMYFLLRTQKNNIEVGSMIIDESIRDQLTGLYNRRIMDSVINACDLKYKNDGIDYSVVMIDINGFKHINDVYGHVAGDVALVGVADCIKNSIRSTDYAIRYGGDEYLIILPGARSEAVGWINSRIQAHANELSHLKTVITLSSGYAMRSECASSDEMIKLADSRMYEMKNCISRLDSHIINNQ